MSIYVGGQQYAKAYVGGVEYTGALAGAEQYLARPDQPGTITAGASRSSGRTLFAIVVTDPDGITSIDSSFLRASDGTQQDISTGWSRRDANTFEHADNRRHDRWRSGLVSAIYTDDNGVQTTITANWSV